jgi:hypothetical protein
LGQTGGMTREPSFDVEREFSPVSETDAKALNLAEDALRNCEEKYRMLLDEVQDYAIFMLDPQGIVISWNAGAERIKGDSQPVQTLRSGTAPAFFLRLVELAAGAASGIGGLQFGFGLLALRPATRSVARTEPAQAWTARASSAGGGTGRCTLSPTRLVAERQLRHGSWRSGISQRGAGAIAGKTCHSRGARRCRLFRPAITEPFGAARVVLHRRGTTDAMGQMAVAALLKEATASSVLSNTSNTVASFVMCNTWFG